MYIYNEEEEFLKGKNLQLDRHSKIIFNKVVRIVKRLKRENRELEVQIEINKLKCDCLEYEKEELCDENEDLKRENEMKDKILDVLRKYISITFEESDDCEGESIYCSIPYTGIDSSDFKILERWLEND